VTDTVPTERPTNPGRALAAALDAVRADRLVPLLQELVRIASVTGSAAETDGQHWLGGHLDRLGLETDLWQVDLAELRTDPDFPGLEVDRQQAWGLAATWGDGPGPTLLLNGHLDVVPVGDPASWQVPPFGAQVHGDRVYGRGACDMKAGLACQVMAVTVLKEAGVRLAGRVQLQSVVGEEDGGLGTFAALRRGHRGDAAVICEPTRLAVVPAAAGALTFRLTITGRAAHASLRDQGVDAVEKYLSVHQALRALEARRNRDPHPLLERYRIPYPLSIGTVRSGDWASSVPDLLVAQGRIGVALGEEPKNARADLAACLDDVCAADPWLREHPIHLEWYGGQFASGQLPSGSPLLGQVLAAHRAVTGQDADVHGVPYGSDLRLLTAAGIPTVHYGPGDIALAHSPNESVPVSELLTATRALVLLVADVCGPVLSGG